LNLSFAKAVDRYVGIALCGALAMLRGARELVAPREGLVEVRTILLVKFWGLGNVVLLLPVVRLLRERHPGARIVFVTLRRNRDILEACPHVDARIYVDDRNAVTLAASLLAAVLRAARERPDLAVDFEQFSRASAILAVLARAKQVVGLATPGQGRAVLYHKRVRYDDRQHMGQTYLDLARAAGVAQRLYRPEPVPIPDACRAEVAALLAGSAAHDAGAPLVVVHPGSGDNFQGRRWPAESFARLADRLVRDEGAAVVLTGTAAEAPLVARVHAAMEEPGGATDAAGRLSVLGLAALVERCALVVTNDTAPVHFGSASGVPVFAFYGPNTPRLYGPLSRGSHAFFRALPCSPCLTNMNYKTSHCRMPVCIRDVGVDEVFERVRSGLAEARAAAALRVARRA
jgi:ADP-heptose:LPS heptosyltransferase